MRPASEMPSARSVSRHGERGPQRGPTAERTTWTRLSESALVEPAPELTHRQVRMAWASSTGPQRRAQPVLLQLLPKALQVAEPGQHADQDL